MRNRPVEPVELELVAACGPGSPLHQRLAALMPNLAEARRQLLSALPSPTLLEEYRTAGGRGIRSSRLGWILATARRMADEVDRVVVVAGCNAGLAARAMLAGCAHPYHNELSRAERGGYPRVYFAPDTVDNDALQALLDLLAPPRSNGDLDSRWALVVADDKGTPENSLVTQALHESLKRSLAGDSDRISQLLVGVPGSRGPEADGLFTAGVLLPAALVGLDVVGLLSGAAAMSDRFAADPPENSAVLQLAGLCHLLGSSVPDSQVEACQVKVWAKSLDATAAWYRRLRQDAFRPPESESPADLHADRLPEKIGRLVLHIAAQRVRRDRLMIGAPPAGPGQPTSQLSEMTQANLAAALAANQAAGQPAVQLRLPQTDERSVGQMLQLLELTTVIEARLATMPTAASRGFAETG